MTGFTGKWGRIIGRHRLLSEVTHLSRDTAQVMTRDMISIGAGSIEANKCVLRVKMTKYHTVSREYVAIVEKHKFNYHIKFLKVLLSL